MTERADIAICLRQRGEGRYSAAVVSTEHGEQPIDVSYTVGDEGSAGCRTVYVSTKLAGWTRERAERVAETLIDLVDAGDTGLALPGGAP